MKIRITEDKAKAMYDDMLDEVAECNFGGASYTGANVLKNVDPIAYECGFVDYIDAISNEYIVEGYTDDYEL